MEIREYAFDQSECDSIPDFNGSADWPVVYMISNDDEAYIGETCSIRNRVRQHLSNPDRQALKRIDIIFDDRANKSATLDVEQSLIRLCSADGRFRLQNLNSGQSASHNYYQREAYIRLLPVIWAELLKRELATHSYDSLVNSDLFKYSPYTALTPEQDCAASEMLHDMVERLSSGRDGTFLVRGSAGTGKTVLAMSLMLTLANASRKDVDSARDIGEFDVGERTLHNLSALATKKDGLRIALVVPMTSLRKTLQKVFKATPGLRSGMVIGPNDVVKDDYDILIVDESHRLMRRRNLTSYGSFDDVCRSLDMDPLESTQLDWILRCSRYRILFYDTDQTVKGSDIPDDSFMETIGEHREWRLENQLRCDGGRNYTDYIRNILACRQKSSEDIPGYDLRLFDDVDEMVESIKDLDKKMGLCRNVAGYSWKWNTKGMSADDISAKGVYDIDIDGHRYIWNMSNSEWILREGSVNEIGCIHTTQGYDLNYVGVIFGREIDYDPVLDEITIDTGLFFDKGVKNGCDERTVREYVINAYRVMLARGIKGCYVYACNRNLREYLHRFIK